INFLVRGIFRGFIETSKHSGPSSGHFCLAALGRGRIGGGRRPKQRGADKRERRRHKFFLLSPISLHPRWGTLDDGLAWHSCIRTRPPSRGWREGQRGCRVPRPCEPAPATIVLPSS